MGVKIVKTDEAIGKKLAYDTTLVTKERAQVLYEKGTLITEEEVKRLKDSGVYYVYVNDEGGEEVYYEWEISEAVCKKAIDGRFLEYKVGKQGAVLVYSKVPGIVQVNREALKVLNSSGTALLISKASGTAVGSHELVAVIDSLPLYVEKEKFESTLKDLRLALTLQQFKYRRVGTVITGTEVYEGRKKDLYSDILSEKARKYGWEIVSREIVPDDEDKISKAVEKSLENADAVIITGGMSVDATDRTPAGIRKAGADVIAYGIPVKPTTMSLIAFKGEKIIFGISAGGIHYRDLNSIDIIFTKLMAGWRPTKEDIALLGDGGLLPNFEASSKLHSE
ncbi:MAG: molybdopterin-binding protein [Nitrososphaeria archaeon]